MHINISLAGNWQSSMELKTENPKREANSGYLTVADQTSDKHAAAASLHLLQELKEKEKEKGKKACNDTEMIQSDT